MPVDRARGQADIPLDAEGLAEADHLGRRIKAKGGIDSLVTSGMQRSIQTAQQILKHNPGVKLYITKGLNPWAQGMLEGVPADRIQAVLRYYTKHPDERVPGVGLTGVPGESIHDHARRVGVVTHESLKTLLPSERKLILGHNSTLRWLHGWAANGFPSNMSSNPEEMASTDPSVTSPPAGELIRLAKRDGKPFLHKNPLDSDEPIRPGLTFARHGHTPFNAPSGSVVHRLSHQRPTLS